MEGRSIGLDTKNEKQRINMTTIKSDKTQINASTETVFDKLSNLENLKTLLDKIPQEKIPEDKKDLFNNLIITSESITIQGGPTGAITLRVTDRLPHSLIRLEGEQTPVPLAMQLEIDPEGPDACIVQVSIHLEIPAMLKPMVSGPLKKMVDQFAAVIKAISFN